MDTHSSTHHAAVIDLNGRELGDKEFKATQAGYDALRRWVAGFGTIQSGGIEGPVPTEHAWPVTSARTGSTCRKFPARIDGHGDRQENPIRRTRGPQRTPSWQTTPQRHHPISATDRSAAIRAVRVARLGAIKAKTAAMNSLRALMVTAPESLRAQLTGLPGAKLVHTGAGFRTGTSAPDIRCLKRYLAREVFKP